MPTTHDDGGPEGVYVALDTDPYAGSAVLPFRWGLEGSTSFLQMRADLLLFAIRREGAIERHFRRHERTMWGESEPASREFDAQIVDGKWRITIPIAPAIEGHRLQFAAYRKDLRANQGWGKLLPCQRFGAKGGEGDQYLSRCEEIDLQHEGEVEPSAGDPFQQRDRERVRIYQLLPRLFGNTNETRRANGTATENGVGKFNDINDAAIASIHGLGCTHVWLTGVLQQASATDYSAIGEPADDPDLLKGIAGSPYAIKDYFDLCPDYAVEPANRRADSKLCSGVCTPRV